MASPKIKLEIVVPAVYVDTVIELIRSHAHTARPGDSKIFVYTVDEVVRISTGEKGESAI